MLPPMRIEPPSATAKSPGTSSSLPGVPNGARPQPSEGLLSEQNRQSKIVPIGRGASFATLPGV